MNTLGYYRENYRKIFNAVENPKFRVFKTVDIDGRVRKNGIPLSTPMKLLKFIERCSNPQSLYVSISEFINPHLVHGFFNNQKKVFKDGSYLYPRAGYIESDNIMLRTHFFADFDSEHNLELAQADGRAMMGYFDEYMGLKPSILQFSGNRGIHEGFKMELEKDVTPVNRLIRNVEERGKIARDLMRMGLKTVDDVHLKIMQDAFRVYAAPYSIKGNGNLVQPLELDEFMEQSIYHSLSVPNLPQQKEPLTASEASADDPKVALGEGHTSPQPYSKRNRASLRLRFFLFLDILVNGLRDTYITVIKKHRSLYSDSMIKNIQERYNLSDFVVFNVGDYVFACNFKLVQFRRLIKILRSAKSENLPYIVTRGHYPIPLSCIVSEDGEQIPITNKRILTSEYGLSDAHSLPHCTAFGVSYGLMVGEHNTIGGTWFKSDDVQVVV
jgi:hypothetical protein